MHRWNATDVSGRGTPPACGSRDRNPPTIGADHITAGPPYTAVDCRRPSFSCRRCPHLEPPAAPRHVRIISACFSKPPEDAPLPASVPFRGRIFSIRFVKCLRTDSCHYCSFYLLTYFLAPWVLELQLVPGLWGEIVPFCGPRG